MRLKIDGVKKANKDLWISTPSGYSLPSGVLCRDSGHDSMPVISMDLGWTLATL